MTTPSASNPQNLRIAFILLGDRNKASSRVRGYWVGEELEALGYRVSYHHALHRWDYLRMLAVMMRHDVLIFQKQYSRYDIALLRISKLMGKRVFFDIDDAPSRTGREVSQRNAATMMRDAHGVFAGSRNLEDLVQEAGGRAHFVPSGIRLDQYRIRGESDVGQVCLGWIGNGAHYVEDLTSILEVPLRSLAAKHDIRLKIVGACGEPKLAETFGGIDGLALDLVDEVNWSDPEAVSAAVADFDIGLYPLIENKFNIYKCAFKALEYMATSIPVVASDVGANGDVITHGSDGCLVSSSEEWVTSLSHLIADDGERHNFGANGRAKVEERYSTKALAVRISGLL
ncbi:glycosyltransferase family 4 protein [Ruegeria atlantica]|uniref:glycosyltransferase family 4 protein n=1 Tax=Ruegeria atlantica TaxID=81569 RepID=UPI002494546F|nr:glycosyltransferase family 4 protein [Ruegeria atlantica]